MYLLLEKKFCLQITQFYISLLHTELRNAIDCHSNANTKPKKREHSLLTFLRICSRISYKHCLDISKWTSSLKKITEESMNYQPRPSRSIFFVLLINLKVYLTVNNIIQIKARIFSLTVVLSPVHIQKHKTAELCILCIVDT